MAGTLGLGEMLVCEFLLGGTSGGCVDGGDVCGGGLDGGGGGGEVPLVVSDHSLSAPSPPPPPAAVAVAVAVAVLTCCFTSSASLTAWACTDRTQPKATKAW